MAGARDGTAAAAPGVGALTLYAAWCGLLIGLFEVAVLAGRHVGLGRLVTASTELWWTIPVFYATLCTPVGGVVAVTRRWFPRLPGVAAVTLLCAAAVLPGPLTQTNLLSLGAAMVLACGLAVRLAAVVAADPARALRAGRRTGPALLALVVAGAALPRLVPHARPLPAAGAARDVPNVILLILDTVRAANLSVYGYHRPTTPNLERIARDGVVFDRAIATSPWTLPSHASMLTGVWAGSLETDWDRPLTRPWPALPAVLRARGFETAAFVSNWLYLQPDAGLTRGFDAYSSLTASPQQALLVSGWSRLLLDSRRLRRWTGSPWMPARISVDQINRRLLDWLDDRDRRPFFAMLNYTEAHDPYLAPAPFDTLYAPRVGPAEALVAGRRTAPPGEVAALRDQYDRALAYLDHGVGRLLDELEARGLLATTIVIVTSDHGEEFGEAGFLGHGATLAPAALWVPLLLRWPGVVPAGRRVGAWVSVRDIAATVLELTGTPQAALPGSSLARYWRARPAAAETVFAEVRFHRGWPADAPVTRGGARAVFAGGWQYATTGHGEAQLLDLTGEPLAAYGRAPCDCPDQRERLRTALQRHYASAGARPRAVVPSAGYAGAR